MSNVVERDTIISAFVKEFTAAQNKAGLTPAYLATSLKRLINARKTDTFKGESTTYEDGKPVKTEDIVVYSKPMADNATRRQALQMALNIRGVQTTSVTSVTNINDAKEVNFMGAVAKILGENGEDVDD